MTRTGASGWAQVVMAEDLVSVERRYLARLGHGMKPVVHIGHEGIAPNVVESADVALDRKSVV